LGGAVIGRSPERTGHWPKPQNTKVLERISDMGLLQNSSHYEMGLRGVRCCRCRSGRARKRGIDETRPREGFPGCFEREPIRAPRQPINPIPYNLAFREFTGKRKL
jgi:hypothetical protein